MSGRLLVTSTDLMMVQFLVPHVRFLSEQGYKVDIACSEVGGRLNEVRSILSPYVGDIFELRLRRSPFSIQNRKGYRDLRKILKNHRYDIIWTNEPVMGVATRLAAREQRKRGCRVLYMAHGFHFFKGAPALNWCLYYPVERLMARYTDILTCVNHEDYDRAQRFGIPEVEYIHGIGINTDRLSAPSARTSIREELGLTDKDFIVLSVGELNKNKNQGTIIRAIARLDNPSIHYVLCGKGAEEGHLRKLVTELKVSDRVHFLGYRKDVVDICSRSDLYAMPSFREGLPVSSLEAMYCGLPLVTSRIRGLTDVNKEGVNGFLCRPDDSDAFAAKIEYLYAHPDMCAKMGRQNKLDVTPYTIANTLVEVKNILDSLLNSEKL